jgi:neutral ceramidase
MVLEVATAPSLVLPRVDGLLAGAAEVDITPPPGMPKAGHSRNAHDGVGFRTRLRARAVHLRAGTSSVVLLATDLLAGSAIVHHLVADQVAEDTDVRLPGIFLGATHTHAGPGQYSGSEFYNAWSANRGGFDPAYTEFLVDQLATAVRTAVARREPARLAMGATEVWGFTRNRSLPAHVRNDGADRRTTAQRRYAAINPWLHLLRVDTRAGHPLAAFVWFSIHGTGISHQDRSYNADVWAYLTGELADRVQRRTGVRPIVGAVEGTHGDMTPAVRPGMLVFHEAERVGRGIGAAADELHERLGAHLHHDVDVAAGLREIPFTREADGVRLAAPRIGVAKLAGAVENTTPLVHLIPPFRPGFPRIRTGGPQGAKRVVGSDLLHTRVNPDADFPQLMPVQVIRIDDRAVVGLPFEVTVESGRRIAAAVEATGIGTAVVSSLANDHCDYLTTPEEYSAQYYEGASTLFGPRQLAWVTAGARDLARDVVRAGTVCDVPDVRRFDFSVRRYYATPSGVDRPRVTRPATFTEATPYEDAYWELRWTDVPAGDLHWHEPLVRVEVEQADGSWVPVADDQGWRVGVFAVGPGKYAARWYAPPLGRPGRYRFVLLANAGRAEVAGAPFD